MNSLSEKFHRYRPTFAALASLREIFRISVAPLPRGLLDLPSAGWLHIMPRLLSADLPGFHQAGG